MPRRKKAIAIKPIPIPGIPEPMPVTSVIELDWSYPAEKRQHGIVHQQGKSYGTEGDRCYYISNEQLAQFIKDQVILLTLNVKPNK